MFQPPARTHPPKQQYALWADGLVEALRGVAAGLPGVPIYITETGCADKGDTVRPVMIESYMKKVEEAVAEGIDLRGVMYWTLIDNFEWQFGFGQKFGVYAWRGDDGQRREPRASAALLKRWFERLVVTCPRLRREAAARRAAAGGGALADGRFVEGELQPLLN